MNYSEILDYKDGVLYWKNTGKRADYLSKHGTYYIRLPNKSTRPAANIVWELHGNLPTRFLENTTGNLLDYSIENLVPKGTKELPTQKFLQDRFFYENGFLFFKATNKIVGTLSKEGYLRFSMSGRIFGLHQLIWIYHFNYLPENLDHIDGDKLNNRIENLRECTIMENRWNTSGRSTKELPKGVYIGKTGGYQVRITYRNVCKSYGTYQNLQEASIVAKKVYQELHGKFNRNG